MVYYKQTLSKYLKSLNFTRKKPLNCISIILTIDNQIINNAFTNKFLGINKTIVFMRWGTPLLRLIPAGELLCLCPEVPL